MPISSLTDGLVSLNYTAAEALRNLRWAKGLSAEFCAQFMKIGLLEFVSKERGRQPFTAPEFAAVAQLLDLDVVSLSGRIGYDAEPISV